MEEANRFSYEIKGNNSNNNIQGNDNFVIHGNSNTVTLHFHSSDDAVKELLQIIVEQNKQILSLTTQLLKSQQ